MYLYFILGDAIMEKLKEKILSEGKVISDSILKVDSFLNHQVDVNLMKEIGEEFGKYFNSKNITKVVTIESSGISPATMTALYLNVPLVFLKKQKPNTLNNDILQTTVKSFTKGETYELTVSKKYLQKDDNILLIDDFLANGEAASGAIRLIEALGSNVSGIGIVIEKSFQPGRKLLESRGYDIYSLARIKQLSDGKIYFL